jgi:SIR2-like domain
MGSENTDQHVNGLDEAPVWVGNHLFPFSLESDVNTHETIQNRVLQMIARSLNTHRTVALIGSGVARHYGQPTWNDLVKIAADEAKLPPREFPGYLVEKDVATLLQSLLDADDPLRSAMLKIMLARREQSTLHADDEEDDGLEFGSELSGVRRRFRESQTGFRDKVSVLEECARLLEGNDEPLHTILMKRFKGVKAMRAESGEGPGPIEKIVELLQIRRFVTTNYDWSIEWAVARSRDPANGQMPEASRLEEEMRRLSINLDVSRPEDLIRFAVAAPGSASGVFHLHGRQDEEHVFKDAKRPGESRSSLVVTEADYQAIYAKDDPTHRTYRRAIDVLFHGNPILFMGAGMEEDDVLRPLRQYQATRGHLDGERPLFAVLPTLHRSIPELAEQRNRLYVTFGVKTYFYETSDTDPRRDEFQRAIETLHKARENWWTSWREKPPIRGIGPWSTHYRTATGTPSAADQHSVCKAIQCQSLVLILGRPGTGKGLIGDWLVTDSATEDWSQRFYRSAHFTNELLSMLQSTAEFLENGSDLHISGRRDPISRIEDALLLRAELVDKESRPPRQVTKLLVLGGIERLLVPAQPSHVPGLLLAKSEPDPSVRDSFGFVRSHGFRPPLPLGMSSSSDAERLFRILARFLIPEAAAAQGRVRNPDVSIVLTSSTIPVELAHHMDSEAIVTLQGIDKEDLSAFPGLTMESELSGPIHEALRGHAYALSVLDACLKKMSSPRNWLSSLAAELTAVTVQQRAELVVRRCVAEFLSQQSTEEARQAERVLRAIADFPTPVSVAVLAKALGIADEAVTASIDPLASAKLILVVERVAADGTKPTGSYTAHRVVRTYSLHQRGALADVPGEPAGLHQATFAQESEFQHTGARAGFKTVDDMIDRLLDAASQHEIFDDGTKPERGAELRGAFGLLRAWGGAMTVGRRVDEPANLFDSCDLPHFAAYQRRLCMLINALRAHSHGKLWDTHRINGGVEGEHAALYAEELAWAYNDTGLAAYCQGYVSDAYSLLVLGQHVGSKGENDSPGQRWCNGEIRLGAVQIDGARLARARGNLESAFTIAVTLEDRDAQAVCAGYLGLLFHLAGDARNSARLYEQALVHMRDRGIRRGTSVFARHLADLKRTQGDTDTAGQLLQESISSAEAGQHLDLVWYARVAHANLRLTIEDPLPQESLEPALEFARSVGIPKLEADVYKIQAHIAMHHGELEVASRLASRCLALGSSLGMNLRVTAALVLMGKIAARRSHRQARALLDAAISMGRRQGYQLQVESATSEKNNLRGRVSFE